MNGESPNSISPAHAGFRLVQRDLRLAMRRPGEWLQPLVFFFVVTTLFPLATDPQLSRLRDIAPGALWVAALLSCLLALELLFREDGQDGTLEQLAVSGLPLSWLLVAKMLCALAVDGFAAGYRGALGGHCAGCALCGGSGDTRGSAAREYRPEPDRCGGCWIDPGTAPGRGAAGTAGAAAGSTGSDLRGARHGTGHRSGAVHGAHVYAGERSSC